MRSIEEIKKEIKKLKGKNKRLIDANNAMLAESTKLKSIPEEKRSILDNLRISEIKHDVAFNNISISTNEFNIKELEKELANDPSQMQPS